VRVRVLGSEVLPPGSSGAVRLHLPVALPLLPGDRFVLRESGRSETVGGGEVLDVDPVLPAARARPDRSVERVVAERGWVGVDDLERLTGRREAPTVGSWVVDPGLLEREVQRVRSLVEEAGPLGFDVATLDDRGRAVLELLDGVEVDQGRAFAGPRRDSLSAHPYLSELAASPFAPPPPDAVPRDELRELVRRGYAVEQDGIYFAPQAVDEASRAVARLLADRRGGVTVAEIRDALGTTRKFLLPLLARLDATGVTRRRGDVRVAGPRLPVTGAGA
jgi:selenocysteine-specific elongation factor